MKNEKLKNQKYAQIYSPDVDNNNTQQQQKNQHINRLKLRNG